MVVWDAVQESGAGNEYVQALQSIEYDALETPETQAAAAKERGNASFQKGKAYHSNAMRYYKEALTHCKQASVRRTRVQLEVAPSPCHSFVDTRCKRGLTSQTSGGISHLHSIFFVSTTLCGRALCGP